MTENNTPEPRAEFPELRSQAVREMETRLAYASVNQTGVFVRSQSPEDKWESIDIVALELPSLLLWLRSRSGKNAHAEALLAGMFGHNHQDIETAIGKLDDEGIEFVEPSIELRNATGNDQLGIAVTARGRPPEGSPLWNALPMIRAVASGMQIEGGAIPLPLPPGLQMTPDVLKSVVGDLVETLKKKAASGGESEAAGEGTEQASAQAQRESLN